MGEGEVTQWLARWGAGDRQALERIVPLVYDELRRLARGQLRRESPGHTLTPTGLVHEVFLRLVDQRRIAASDREGFLAVAGQVMRRVLVDHARSRKRLKRGGPDGVRAEPEVSPPLLSDTEIDEVLAIDRALERLDDRARRVVEYRLFCGLSVEETAGALGVSSKTVQRTWRAAIAWLRNEVAGMTDAPLCDPGAGRSRA